MLKAACNCLQAAFVYWVSLIEYLHGTKCDSYNTDIPPKIQAEAR